MKSNKIESSEYFDESYYTKTYPIPEGISPAEHYLHYGYKMCYNPSENFSTSGYYFLNKDTLKAGVNPLLHYEISKFKENRKWMTDEEVIDNTIVFDPYFYIIKNMEGKYDVSEREAARHYLAEGWKNGLSVSDTVDLIEYCSSLPDSEKKCVPLLHYIIFGCIDKDINVSKDIEYRKNIKIIEESTFFDKKFYRKKYGIGAKIEAARHYYEYGAKKFYDPSEDFSTSGYVAENKIDLNENALVHYEKNMLNGDVYRVSNKIPFSGQHNVVDLSERSEYKISGHEEKLLELLLKYSEAQRNDYLRRNSDCFFISALSGLRANSIEWIPVDSSENVLVVGAGYGEIVPTLAQKCNSITCFDSEMSKILINKARNSGYDNVIYYIADDAEAFYRSLGEKKFDYIFIVGAFENAAKYYPQENDPQIKMLEHAKSHLTKKGIIVLAFDNTYAIKYFNGSLRDATGQYFDTITGINERKDNRTFTMREVSDHIERLGLTIGRVYYPFPDYHIPFSIYTDDYSVKGGEIGEPDYAWEEGKIRLFEEKKAYAAASARGCLDMLSNSFILTITNSNNKTIQSRLNDIVYVKYSNDRDESFRIKTEIRENKDGIKTVCKIPMSKFSQNHIQKIYKNYLNLSAKYSDDIYRFNACRYDGYKTEFEFLDGKLLYDRVVEMIAAEDYDAVFAETDKLYNMLNKDSVYFIPCRKFKEVFGNVSLPAELKACTVGDIDLILQNIIIDADGKYNILDYEWTFNFPVPVLYILFRSILYLSIDASNIVPHTLIKELYSRYDLTDDIISEFTKMENSFQQYVLLGHIPMRQFSKNGQMKLFEKPIQIFEDVGNGFGISSMRNCDAVLSPDGVINAKIYISEDVKRLRIDPGSKKCIVKVIRAADSDGNALDYKTNGKSFGDNCWFFRTNDPNIVFNSVDTVISPQKIIDKTNYIDISLEITTFTTKISESI